MGSVFRSPGTDDLDAAGPPKPQECLLRGLQPTVRGFHLNERRYLAHGGRDSDHHVGEAASKCMRVVHQAPKFLIPPLDVGVIGVAVPHGGAGG